MAAYVKVILIPRNPEKDRQPLARLVDKIIVAKKADPDADVSVDEEAPNALVYELYASTVDEIEIVKEGIQTLEENAKRGRKLPPPK